MWVCGVCCNRKIVIDFDYTEYLGPDYKKKYREDITTSTYISNHVSWVDTMFLYQFYRLALTLDIGFQRAPLMGKMATLIDSIFLPRAQTEEKRAQAIQTIVDR